MLKKRLRFLWISTIALVVAVAAVYAIGYFVGPETRPGVDVRSRYFRTKWQATMYSPAAFVEAPLTGKDIIIGYIDDGMIHPCARYRPNWWVRFLPEPD